MKIDKLVYYHQPYIKTIIKTFLVFEIVHSWPNGNKHKILTYLQKLGQGNIYQLIPNSKPILNPLYHKPIFHPKYQ